MTDASEPVTGGLPDHLEAPHRRFIGTEMVIGSFMSGLVPALVIWILRTPLSVPVFGANSLASALIPATLMPAFGLPIVLTLVVRYRVRSGSAPALGWPLRVPVLARFLPGPLVLRGLMAAGVAMLIVPPVGLLLMFGLGVTSVSGLGFIVYNFFHGAATGALLLRPVVTRALSDGSRTRRARLPWSTASAK